MIENTNFCPTKLSRCCDVLSVWRKEAEPVAETLFFECETMKTAYKISNLECDMSSELCRITQYNYK